MYSRKRIRKIVLVVVLLLLLTLLTVFFVNFRATRQLGLNIAVDPDAVLDPPQYLFSFSGPEDDPLARPLGVLVDGERVFVTDSRRGLIDVFDLDGARIGQWTSDRMEIPLYMSRHPLTGNYYCADRRTRTVLIFTPEGEMIGEFDPNLPPEELPEFETAGVSWAPVALDFGADGSLYVAEILNGHRLLVFDADGQFKRSVGTAGIVEKASDSPTMFQFPNAVKVRGDEVWVADSNNRRIQIFNLDGGFERIFPAEGLPRGIDFLRGASQSEEGTSSARFAIVDTLSHDVTIWTAAGKKLGQFGENGVLEGQFAYPNDISIAESGRLYVADTANGRIQVWGWPRDEQPIPTPQTPAQWGWCLSPLLLIPLFLLLRKRKFFATEDFVVLAFESENAKHLPGRRRKWFVLPEVYEAIKHLEDGDVKAEELFHAVEHSESDAEALMDQLEVDHETAVILSVAQRAKVFSTEDEELRRLAKMIEIEAYNLVRFLERFARKYDQDQQQ